MKCKFLFRGKAVEIRPRRFTGKVGKVLTIDGTDYEVCHILDVREGLQVVSLHRCTPDPEELQVVRDVLNEVRVGLRAMSPTDEPYQPGCNLPQVRGKREGKAEALVQALSLLERIEKRYLNGG